MPNLERQASRHDLAAFLRSRRERLSPQEAGFVAGARRRTAGLRREEVAQLAGVGLTWYTWFEQGRDIQVSAHFLERLALALRLTGAERAHLYDLAQHRPPPTVSVAVPEVSSALRAMIESLPNPAYVKTARWDVVAWNAAAADTFGDYGALPPARRNVLWLVFTSPEYRRIMTDWEGDARRVLAKFRLDHGAAGDDPAFAQLVAELSDASQEFRRWWLLHDVQGRGEGIKRLYHAVRGEIEFEHTAFVVDGAPQLRLVVYTPLYRGAMVE
jgi:transcriptional regulator with XRE-family HTH domain